MSNSIDLDETAHLDLRSLQKPIIIACGSLRVYDQAYRVLLKTYTTNSPSCKIVKNEILAKAKIRLLSDSKMVKKEKEKKKKNKKKQC